VPHALLRPAALAVSLAFLIPLTACQSAGTAAPAPSSSLAISAATESPVGASQSAAQSTQNPATATGSVTVSVTSPVTESGSTGAAVSCARAGLLYVASARNAYVAGYAHSFTVRVLPYRGPGAYRALATLTVVGPHGGIASVSAVPGTPTTITNSGGTFTIDATGSQGRTLAATVSWTCP
jgi:hypothetical protein